MTPPKIIQVGNLIPPTETWSNKQYGRVYSVAGIAPTLISARVAREGIQILVQYN